MQADACQAGTVTGAAVRARGELGGVGRSEKSASRQASSGGSSTRGTRVEWMPSWEEGWGGRPQHLLLSRRSPRPLLRTLDPGSAALFCGLVRFTSALLRRWASPPCPAPALPCASPLPCRWAPSPPALFTPALPLRCPAHHPCPAAGPQVPPGRQQWRRGAAARHRPVAV